MRDRARRWPAAIMALGVLLGSVACTADESADPTTTPLASIPSGMTVHELTTKPSAESGAGKESGAGASSDPASEPTAGESWSGASVSRSTGETWVSSGSAGPPSAASPDETPPDESTPDQSTQDQSTPDETTQDESSPQTSPSSSEPPADSSSTPSPKQSGAGQLSAEEKADRAEIEKVWLEFWKVQETLMETPAKDRKTVFSKTMADPVLSDTIDKAETYESEKVEPIGSIKHELRWGPSVDGEDEIAMADCQDQSRFGLFDIAGDQILTHGAKRANMHGTFVRTANGWKVSAFIQMDTRC